MDWALEKRLTGYCKLKKINYIEMDSPAFLTTWEEINDYFADKKNYFLTSFYIWQRKGLNILMDKEKPVGGKWTYDKENRKKIPQGTKIPFIIQLKENKYVKEAKRYVDNKFPITPGPHQGLIIPPPIRKPKNGFRIFWNINYPFLETMRTPLSDESFLFHSVISSSLNNGLITPDEILKQLLRARNIPLNSLEGFIRQIIGWREFLRAVYIKDGLKERTTNFLQNKNKMNEKLYQGHTGLEPYDKVVQKVIKQAFTHHIERLMVLGNLMLLVDLDSDEVYKWFMEMFIDSYDWVMVPNVYGMSQYADGGLITTKPYFSSSNYLLRMSDFSRGDWCKVWDGLFWCFVKKHQDLISKNPRLAVLKRNLKNRKKMIEHHKNARNFRKNIGFL
ncbi:MAG: cryptochrome/photolyase family protein [Euryarchaeota archaeon]|nr:cryptochrome/photolyase family protein [Euryarchaeota archaeon]MBU4547577.1 cryptochrome/photolyase family protein [Euryarchaeota archaeon]MBV1754895.1 cryptochrome/photolyase family protein [Methanobacterium sp.]MBV1767342.1 cryptochrome/photolyase family protein [Methanobacterium sp.]